MTTSHSIRLSALVAGVALLGAAAPLAAQAWHYPTFLTPNMPAREFGAIVAGAGDAGTSLVGRWAEGITPKMEINFDVGFNDPKAGDLRFLLGGALGYKFMSAGVNNAPLDLKFTAGVFPAFGGDLTTFRIPIGVSIGKRFVTQGGLALTPYAHPRLSLDYCSSDVCSEDRSDFSINVEGGVDLELSRQASIRTGFVIASGDAFNDVAFGLGFAWRPSAVRR